MIRRILAGIRLRLTPEYRAWRARRPVCESYPISGLVSDPEGDYCPRGCAYGCLAAYDYDAWLAERPETSREA